MKGFVRENQWLSLCGLNCGLCTMNLSGHCGGCGNGNQSCKIARCSLEHGGVAYCFECADFPCMLYTGIGQYDSFITHQHQMADLAKAQRIGLEAYSAEQQAKRRLLERLLAQYNDGRRKTFYALAVNLLALADVEALLAALEEENTFSSLDQKAQVARLCEGLNMLAEQDGVVLKLRKKK